MTEAMAVNSLESDVYEIIPPHGRAFFIEDEENGNILIESSWDAVADGLVAAIEENFGNVETLVLTHAHETHYTGADKVVEAFDPELYVPEGSELGEKLDADPDVVYNHSDVIADVLEVIRVPGHTDHTSAMRHIEKKCVFSGDTMDGSDRRGLPPGYILPAPAKFNWDPIKAEENLVGLLDYDIERIYVNHGTHITEDPLEKIDEFLYKTKSTEYDFADHSHI